MKWYSLWLFLIFAIWAEVQAKEIAYLQNSNGLVYEVNHTEPFTGKQVEKWGNGQKQSEVDFAEGKQVGFTAWYENGQEKNYFFEKAIRIVKAQNAKNIAVVAGGGQPILPETISEWIEIIDDGRKLTTPNGEPAYISGQGSSDTRTVGLQFNNTKKSLIITRPAFEGNPRSVVVITFNY